MERELRRVTADMQNVRFARQRFQTIWGGSSLIDMIVASIQVHELKKNKCSIQSSWRAKQLIMKGRRTK